MTEKSTDDQLLKDRPAMADILARRRRELEEEGVAMPPAEEAPDETPKPEDEPAPESQEPKQTKEPEPDTEKPADKTPEDTPAEEPPTEDAPRKYTVVVNGETREIDETELIKGYQTGAAATKRFQEAKRLRDEADQLAQQSKRTQPEPEPQPTAKKPEPPDYKTLIEAIRFGDDTEAEKALRQLHERDEAPGEPGLSVDDVRSMLDEHDERTRRELAWQQDMTRLREKYPEVVQSPQLQNVATSFELELRTEELRELGYGEDQLQGFYRFDNGELLPKAKVHHYEEQAKRRVSSEFELWGKAAERALAWRDSLTTGTSTPAEDNGSTPPPDASTTTQAANGVQTADAEAIRKRKDRKASLDQPPQPATASSEVGGNAAAPKSRSDVINEMRKQRAGQG